MQSYLKDVFKSLKKHDVKYTVIGGIASILHGVPRTTFDLDILIESSLENAQHLLNAFIEIGLGTALLTNAEDVVNNEVTIFKDKVRIDVQTKTPGIIFSEVWNRKVTMDYHGCDVFILSKEDLISSKKAAGRPIDLEDVRLLTLPDKVG